MDPVVGLAFATGVVRVCAAMGGLRVGGHWWWRATAARCLAVLAAVV
jgi:hypothetical protein